MRCPGMPFVQDASRAELCKRFPPFGLRHAMRCARMNDAFDLLDVRHEPPPCVAYNSCAVVGSSGRLIGAGHGPLIDGHEAVFRANAAPDGREVTRMASGTDRSRGAWIHDLGVRTTWQVVNAGNLMLYQRRQRLRARKARLPRRGRALNCTLAHDVAQPKFAMFCQLPLNSYKCEAGKLRAALDDERTFVVNPLMLLRHHRAHFAGKQLAPTTGFVALALARELCREVHVYGFGDATECPGACYHYYEDCRASNISERRHFAFHGNLKFAREANAGAERPARAAVDLETIVHYAGGDAACPTCGLAEQLKVPQPRMALYDAMATPHNFTHQVDVISALAREGRIVQHALPCAPDF